jgi:hypothetical protein
MVGVRNRSATPRSASASPSARTRASGGAGCRRNGSSTTSVRPPIAGGDGVVGRVDRGAQRVRRRQLVGRRATDLQRGHVADGAVLPRLLDGHVADTHWLAHPADRHRDALLSLGQHRLARPVAPEQQLVRCLLADAVQLAHWQEEPHAQPVRVHRTERERRLAQTAELLAQLRGVERALAGWCQRHLAADRHLVLAGAEDRLERPARVAEHPHVQPGASGPRALRERRVAGARALEQRRVRGPHDAPSRRDAPAGADRLPGHPGARRQRARRRDGEARARARGADRRLEADAVADGQGLPDLDQQLGALAPDHHAQLHAGVVRLRPRDVLAPCRPPYCRR